jgi:hypothetical protein
LPKVADFRSASTLGKSFDSLNAEIPVLHYLTLTSTGSPFPAYFSTLNNGFAREDEANKRCKWLDAGSVFQGMGQTRPGPTGRAE